MVYPLMIDPLNDPPVTGHRVLDPVVVIRGPGPECLSTTQSVLFHGYSLIYSLDYSEGV
jgi:hypothetical protein